MENQGAATWVKPNCPFKQFSTVFFKGCTRWIPLLFYFFLERRLKTLNKEQYDLTHVVLVVILQIFVKNTRGLADRDWRAMQFDAFCQSKKSI